MPAGATPPLPQAWSLLLVGPFLDKLVTADWVFSYTFTAGGWVRGGAVRGGAVRCGAVRCDAPICSALKCSRIPIGNVPANVHTDSCTLHCRRCRRAAAAAAAGAMFVLIASCSLAVLVNVSQFMCLGRFSAVSFQVGVGGGCRGFGRRGRPGAPQQQPREAEHGGAQEVFRMQKPFHWGGDVAVEQRIGKRAEEE